MVVFEKSSLQYGPETHGAGGGDVAIVREGELVRDALLPPGHRLQSGNIQQRRHNKQENQGACHAGRYCDLAVCEDFGIYFNNQETKEDRHQHHQGGDLGRRTDVITTLIYTCIYLIIIIVMFNSFKTQKATQYLWKIGQ